MASLSLTIAAGDQESREVGLTVEQALMLMDMNELREEKAKKMKPELLKTWFPLSSLKQETIIGGFSWTCLTMGKKWILERYAHNIGAGWVTPADIARDYLTVKYSKVKRRVSSAQYAAVCTIPRSQPLYAEPQIIEKALYVDIRSAYWSILQAVGWDVDYFPGRFMSVRSNMADFPVPFIKLARNCLVSMGLPSPMKVWDGERLKFINKYNPLTNKVLWSLVQDVLHGVAREVQPYAAYINTDGYIIPAENFDQVDYIISSWGLPSSVKHEGRAVIYGAGQYNIEGKSWHEPRGKRGRSVYKIDNVQIDWLKPRFLKFAQRRIIS